MQKINAIFFDLFNTLISVGDVPEHVGRFTADILGFDREQWNVACFSEVHEICKPTKSEDVLYSLAKSIDPDISRELIMEAAEHRQRRFDYALTQVRQDVLDVLSDLKKRDITLALVSNASTNEVSAWPNSPLSKIFDYAFFSCECGFKKPNNDIYLHAIDFAGTQQENSLFVGDGGSNEFHGAHQVGLTTVHTTQFSAPHRVERVRHHQGDAIQHEITHIGGVLELLGR